MKGFLSTATVVLWLSYSVIFATVPAVINFQGVLKDGGGNPVADGSYVVTFSIYDVPSGGTALWDERTSVTTSGGLFNVLLGAVSPVPDSAFAHSSCYLATTVESDPELVPRQKLSSVAFAYRVGTVDGALGGNILTKVSIGPGHSNTGAYAFIAGVNNTASGDSSCVGGGGGNTASGSISTIGGGSEDSASSLGSTVGGGRNNVASGPYSTVAGGELNRASEIRSTVGGGGSNTANEQYSTVGGGSDNVASSVFATIGGGTANIANGGISTVCGGSNDTASGNYSTAAGGFFNTAGGNASFAAGYRAKARHGGSFVWADAQEVDFGSTGGNQFLIRASGGLGLGSNNPLGMMQIATTNDNVDPTFVATWDKRHVVIGGSGNAGGLGFSFDQTNNHGYIEALIPNVGWLNLTLQSGGGRVGIGTGTAVPAATLQVAGTAGNNTGVWSNLSDRRLKRDVAPIRNALEIINKLQPVSFRWKDSEKDAQFGRVRGLIAQDVEKVIPEWIKTDPDGYKRIEPIGVDALLIQAIKELKAENEDLRRDLLELKTQQRRADDNRDVQAASDHASDQAMLEKQQGGGSQ